jgi:hypothetical protein
VSGGELPEVTGEGNMLLVIEMLLAKKDDLPPQQGRMDGLYFFWCKRAGQIDATDFCSDVYGEWSYVDRTSTCHHIVLHTLYSHPLPSLTCEAVACL